MKKIYFKKWERKKINLRESLVTKNWVKINHLFLWPNSILVRFGKLKQLKMRLFYTRALKEEIYLSQSLIWKQKNKILIYKKDTNKNYEYDMKPSMLNC